MDLGQRTCMDIQGRIVSICRRKPYFSVVAGFLHSQVLESQTKPNPSSWKTLSFDCSRPIPALLSRLVSGAHGHSHANR